MADETDVAGEVARVLIDHTRISGILGDCSCGHRVPLGHSFTAHQAAMLAEAGLLREDIDLRRRITREVDAKLATARDLNRLQAQMGRLTEERAAECIGNAFQTWSTHPTVQDAARRVVAMVQAEPQEAQIATQEPAGAKQGGSGDSRASGGLDGAAAASPLDEVHEMFFGKDAP